MTALVFVDSNVLLYWRDASDSRKQSLAEDWLDQLWRDGSGRLSAQVLSEYYDNITRKIRPGLDPDQAWTDVSDLMEWDPQPIDGEVLGTAREVQRRYRLSWWDSLIVAAAQIQHCTLLLTEDLQDGAQYGSVTVRSPFTLSVQEAAAQYPATPTVSRHPPRGRPRKHPVTQPHA